MVEPVDSSLGAIVTGVTLAALDDAHWAAICGAFLKHAVLVFPGQHLSEDDQIAFGRRFGPLEKIGRTEGMAAITNQRRDGTLLATDDPVMHILNGNEGWHTDSSYMPVAAKASILSAHVVAATGGQTEWADMRAAYDALAPAMKQRIAGLSAYHSLVYSQRRLGFDDAPAGAYGYDVADPPQRTLIKVHPETGRPSLFIGRHAHGIEGLTAEDSEALLDELLAFACQPPRVYRHEWRVGDVVVWDNRCVLHRVRPWSSSEPRVMKHTRVSGDPRSEADSRQPTTW